MRKLAVITFLTLDGVMQAPASPEEDRSGGFTSGGWAQRCWDEVMEQVGREAMAEPYDLLLGRKTYETFAAHFPSATGPHADLLNAATKYVVTSSPEELSWENSVSLGQDVVTEVSRLKHESGPLLQIHGSWQLLQTLICHQLVDEYRLWTFPVLVGSGKRLFAGGAAPADLTLLNSDRTTGGAVMSIYSRRPNGADLDGSPDFEPAQI